MVNVLQDPPQKVFEPRDVFQWSLAPVLKGAPGESPTGIAPAPKPRIAYLVGSDLNPRIVHDPKEPIYNQGSTNCDDLRVTDKTAFYRVHVTKGYFRQQFRYNLENFDCLLNLVTDPDQHPRVLRNMVRLVDGFRGRVVNHPATVLRSGREDVARRAAGLAGVRVPKALRLASSNPDVVRNTLAAAQFAFPALLRLPGTHDGQFTGLFQDIDSLIGALAPKQEYIVTEFVDYRSADGLHRKYRMFFFGEKRVFRHMLVANHWNVHAGNGNAFMIDRPALLDEEARLFADDARVLGPDVMGSLAAIRAAVGLDFMGVDFGFTRDGTLLLFEANASMGFFPFFDDPRVAYRQACLEPAQQAFDAMLGLR